MTLKEKTTFYTVFYSILKTENSGNNDTTKTTFHTVFFLVKHENYCTPFIKIIIINITAGLRRILDKILETNSLDLDTAKIYMEDPHPTGAIFPYRLGQDQEDGRRQGAKRKSTKNKGIKTPVHKSAN